MNNEEKGKYLLDAITKVNQQLKHGRCAEYPYRKSLQLRWKLVLAGTKAEDLAERLQTRLIPDKGDIEIGALTDKANAISVSTDATLYDVFKGYILQDDLGI